LLNHRRHSGNPPAGGASRDSGQARTFWMDSRQARMTGEVIKEKMPQHFFFRPHGVGVNEVNMITPYFY